MRYRNAFTIVESMLASVVLATAVLGISSGLATSYQQNGSIRERGIMVQLARSLSEETASMPYTNALGLFGGGWNAGQKNRRLYDDVFDFDGYTDQSPFTSIATTGIALDYGADYSRTVKVEPLATPSTTAISPELSNFARVTVCVRSPSGHQVTLHRWVARVDIKR